jgi:hypothetical protein
VELDHVEAADAQSRLRRAFALIMRAAYRAEQKPLPIESRESTQNTDP